LRPQFTRPVGASGVAHDTIFRLNTGAESAVADQEGLSRFT